MRAIDADSLISLVKDSTILGNGFKQAFVAIVKGEPTIEPDILTCEDCKYADEKPISDGRHWCNLHGYFMYYCSDDTKTERAIRSGRS